MTVSDKGEDMTTTLAEARTALAGTEPDETPWQKLKRPFEPSEISKRPQPTVKADQYRQLEKSSCNICGGYHPAEKTIHLDYIGHARVTQRLNEVDPEWTWTWGADDPETGKPSKHLSLTTDPDGSVSLWMAMTALGVTRRDVGYAPAKAEQLKDVVSDAISRCGMRFGIGLGLWIKEQCAAPVQTASPWRHEKDGREPQGAPCPSDGCTGHLVQRTAKKDGHPFLSCDSWSRVDPGCGIKPIDGTMEDYVKSIGLGEGTLDPAEFGEPFPFGPEERATPQQAAVFDALISDSRRPPTPIEAALADVSLRPPSGIPPLTGGPANCQEIRRLIEGMAPETIRDVFTSVPGGAAIISPRPTGGWKLGLGKLADAGEAVQIELIAALVKVKA